MTTRLRGNDIFTDSLQHGCCRVQGREPLNVRPGRLAVIPGAVCGAGWRRRSKLLPGFFDGLTVVPPGIVSASRWRPGSDDAGEDATVCGAGFK